MPTTLELPDPLFARLKARAASEGAGLLEQASEPVLFSTVTALGLVRRVRFDRDVERFAGLQRLPLP